VSPIVKFEKSANYNGWSNDPADSNGTYQVLLGRFKSNWICG